MNRRGEIFSIVVDSLRCEAVGEERAKFARHFPCIAVNGYEIRARGEELTSPIFITYRSQSTKIYKEDNQYKALEYGWYFLHRDRNRPLDGIDFKIMKTSYSEKEFRQMSEAASSFIYRGFYTKFVQRGYANPQAARDQVFAAIVDTLCFESGKARQAKFARHFPWIALEGYEIRARGEYLIEPISILCGPRNTKIYRQQNEYKALEYGWRLLHDDRNRPRDDLDLQEERDSENMDWYQQMWNGTAWSDGPAQFPKFVQQGYAAREAGLPPDPPEEIVAADDANGTPCSAPCQKAWLSGWHDRDLELTPDEQRSSTTVGL